MHGDYIGGNFLANRFPADTECKVFESLWKICGHLINQDDHEAIRGLGSMLWDEDLMPHQLRGGLLQALRNRRFSIVGRVYSTIPLEILAQSVDLTAEQTVIGSYFLELTWTGPAGRSLQFTLNVCGDRMPTIGVDLHNRC